MIFFNKSNSTIIWNVDLQFIVILLKHQKLKSIKQIVVNIKNLLDMIMNGFMRQPIKMQKS